MGTTSPYPGLPGLPHATLTASNLHAPVGGSHLMGSQLFNSTQRHRRDDLHPDDLREVEQLGLIASLPVPSVPRMGTKYVPYWDEQVQEWIMYVPYWVDAIVRAVEVNHTQEALLKDAQADKVFQADIEAAARIGGLSELKHLLSQRLASMIMLRGKGAP